MSQCEFELPESEKEDEQLERERDPVLAASRVEGCHAGLANSQMCVSSERRRPEFSLSLQRRLSPVRVNTFACRLKTASASSRVDCPVESARVQARHFYAFGYLKLSKVFLISQVKHLIILVGKDSRF